MYIDIFVFVYIQAHTLLNYNLIFTNMVHISKLRSTFLITVDFVMWYTTVYQSLIDGL